MIIFIDDGLLARRRALRFRIQASCKRSKVPIFPLLVLPLKKSPRSHRTLVSPPLLFVLFFLTPHQRRVPDLLPRFFLSPAPPTLFQRRWLFSNRCGVSAPRIFLGYGLSACWCLSPPGPNRTSPALHRARSVPDFCMVFFSFFSLRAKQGQDASGGDSFRLDNSRCAVVQS